MGNSVILITGCQRSGTTLLHLILDSHPNVHGVDETEYTGKKRGVYLNNPSFSPWVSFKLPRAACAINFIRSLANRKVLWCIRDPRDVVASMIRLQISLTDTIELPWAAHPEGAVREIRNAYEALHADIPGYLIPLLQRYRDNLRRDPATLPQSDLALAGALCWRLKNMMPTIYSDNGFDARMVAYETLTREPEPELRRIINFLGMPWSDCLLNHHRTHSGIATGNTPADRPINTSSIGQWKKLLSNESLEMVRIVCGEIAGTLGYVL